jgi:uncharacterized protein YbbC (DUF1343 family)
MKFGILFTLCLTLFACNSTSESITKSFSLAEYSKTAQRDLTLNAPVRLGDERIFDDYASVFQGKKIGILAHYASRLSDGTHVVDALKARADFNLTLIFSPEHGFRSIADTSVPDSIDPITGVQIYSLYGPRRAPTPAMFAQIDLVLVDLQDVGLRYYTYPATVVDLLKAAKLANKPVYILDRPNPLGGAIVEGAILDANLADGDLTTIAQIPTRTGMTLGETSLYLNQELNVGADLHVIPMSNWNRTMHWADTGLNWTPSSPALPTPEQVELYAMFGTLEAPPLATGRGLTPEQAFRRYGAPYITQAQAQTIINGVSLPGLKLSYVEWTPTSSEFVGQLCRGFQVDVTDLSQVQGFRSLIDLSKIMVATLGAPLKYSEALVMLGGKWLLDGIEAQTDTQTLLNKATSDLQPFLAKRQSILLY